MAIRSMGIRPVMITGDQPLTAKSIANEVGINDYVARAKPEDKHDIVLKEQADSRIVAMIGDGTNDAPALAVADVGLAMNSGTQAAKEAANMVDMESNPAKIIDVVMLGKQTPDDARSHNCLQHRERRCEVFCNCTSSLRLHTK